MNDGPRKPEILSQFSPLTPTLVDWNTLLNITIRKKQENHVKKTCKKRTEKKLRQKNTVYKIIHSMRRLQKVVLNWRDARAQENQSVTMLYAMAFVSTGIRYIKRFQSDRRDSSASRSIIQGRAGWMPSGHGNPLNEGRRITGGQRWPYVPKHSHTGSSKRARD